MSQNHPGDENLEIPCARLTTTDFHSWIGLALKEPLNPRPRFRSDDELWECDR